MTKEEKKEPFGRRGGDRQSRSGCSRRAAGAAPCAPPRSCTSSSQRPLFARAPIEQSDRGNEARQREKGGRWSTRRIEALEEDDGGDGDLQELNQDTSRFAFTDIEGRSRSQ